MKKEEAKQLREANAQNARERAEKRTQVVSESIKVSNQKTDKTSDNANKGTATPTSTAGPGNDLEKKNGNKNNGF